MKLTKRDQSLFMNSSRKIAKCHQQVLVFVKGNPTSATKRLPKFTEENASNLDEFML